MKKLGVILLAMFFIFGLAVQASAFVKQVGKEAFAGVEPITFDDVSHGEEILSKYWESDGVNFSQSVFGDNLSLFSFLYFGSPTLTNLYMPNLQSQIGGDPPFEPVITLNFRERLTGVGFWVYPTNGSVITVVVLRDGAEPFEFTHNTALLGRFIGIQDLEEGIDSIEVSADGQFADFVSVLFMNDLLLGDPLETSPAEIEVEVEIKPPNCLGARISINEKSQGVTPVVIVGNGTYDVTEIDPATVLLHGVAPVRDAIEYASTCNAEGGDGELDLALKFNTQELVGAMGISQADVQAMENGEWPSKSLQLRGNLFEESGGTAITGEVSVTLVGKVKEDKEDKGKGKNK